MCAGLGLPFVRAFFKTISGRPVSDSPTTLSSRVKMKKVLFAVVALLGIGIGQAQAAGCLKGAAVGAVAGHVAGHHAVAGAVIGCAVGHHRAHEQQKKLAAERAAAQQVH